MFREMRRFKNGIPREAAIEMLESCSNGVLSVIGKLSSGLHSRTALYEQRIPADILRVVAGQEDADFPDILLRVAVAAQRDRMQVLFEHFRVFTAPDRQFIRHNQRTDHVDIDIVRAPFGCRNTAQSPDSFLCRCIGALSRVA